MTKRRALAWGKFWWGNWLADEQLALAGHEAKGFWMDCLAIMSVRGVSELCHTPDDLARLTRTTPARARALAKRLLDSGAVFGHVTPGSRDGRETITLVSRRLRREEKQRVSAKRRQERRRGASCHAPVTPPSQTGHNIEERGERKEERVSPHPPVAPQAPETGPERESVAFLREGPGATWPGGLKFLLDQAGEPTELGARALAAIEALGWTDEQAREHLRGRPVKTSRFPEDDVTAWVASLSEALRDKRARDRKLRAQAEEAEILAARGVVKLKRLEPAADAAVPEPRKEAAQA